MKRFLPLLLVLGGGLLLWNTGLFGVFPTDRSVVWRFPVSYRDVRSVDLQIWDGETLLKHEELRTPEGLTSEPTFSIPLSRGTHKAIARLELAGGEIRGFQRDIEAGTDETLLIQMAP